MDASLRGFAIHVGYDEELTLSLDARGDGRLCLVGGNMLYEPLSPSSPNPTTYWEVAVRWVPETQTLEVLEHGDGWAELCEYEHLMKAWEVLREEARRMLLEGGLNPTEARGDAPSER
jgi:hypothetical protein